MLHPPGYYLPAAVLDKVLWSKDAVTRLTGLRYYDALLGAFTIFFAWLLAAQILAREWQQLAAAALASLQPILAFSASTLTNDVGVALTLTATLAWCAWMLRGPPRARQGIGLGVAIWDRTHGEGHHAVSGDCHRRRADSAVVHLPRCPP